jgi:uncharacterized protein (TIGR02217 family)
MSIFHEAQFPSDLGWGARGGPIFNTTVLGSASGYEQRNVNWRYARCVYTVGHIMKDRDGAHQLQAFFNARSGGLAGFRFKDWSDFQCDATTGIFIPLTGGGSQMCKLYKQPDDTGNQWVYIRPIFKPCSGLVADVRGVFPPTPTVSGVSGTIDFTKGVISGTVGAWPNGASWAGEFDVPVRFGVPQSPGDLAQLEMRMFEDIDWSSIQLVEIKMSNAVVTVPTAPGGSFSDGLTLLGFDLSSNLVNTTDTPTVTATILLSGNAPTGGSTVVLIADNPSVALIHDPVANTDVAQANIIVPAGTNTVNVTIKILAYGHVGVGVGTTNITASHGGNNIGTALQVYEAAASYTSPAGMGTVSRSGGVSTASFVNPYYPPGGWTVYVGRTLTVTGCVDASFNGTFTITAGPAGNVVEWAQGAQPDVNPGINAGPSFVVSVT